MLLRYDQSGIYTMRSISVMDQVLRGNIDLIGPKSLPNKKLSLSCPLTLLMALLGSLSGFSKSLRASYAVRFSRLAFGVLVWLGKQKLKKEDAIFSSMAYYIRNSFLVFFCSTLNVFRVIGNSYVV